VDALVTRRWRLNDSVLLRQWRLHIVVRAGSILALRGCLLLRVSVGGASLMYSKAEQQRCDLPRRSSRRYGTLTWRFSQLLGPKAKPMCQAIVPEL
jgi:hypothetical protein